MTTGPRLTARPGLHSEEVDGDIVVLEPSSGMLHVLTGTAAAAWSLLQGGSTRSVLVDELTRRYGVGGDPTAAAELEVFVDDLVGRGLVVPAA